MSKSPFSSRTLHLNAVPLLQSSQLTAQGGRIIKPHRRTHGTLSCETPPHCASLGHRPAGFIFFLLSIMRCTCRGTFRLLPTPAEEVPPAPGAPPGCPRAGALVLGCPLRTRSCFVIARGCAAGRRSIPSGQYRAGGAGGTDRFPASSHKLVPCV